MRAASTVCLPFAVALTASDCCCACRPDCMVCGSATTEMSFAAGRMLGTTIFSRNAEALVMLMAAHLADVGLEPSLAHDHETPGRPSKAVTPSGASAVYESPYAGTAGGWQPPGRNIIPANRQ